MFEFNINETYLLLLIENNGIIDTTKIKIDNHFENEIIELNRLCEGSNDNINEIINFINYSVRPKLTNQKFNFCKKLDEPYQSVYLNIEGSIQSILAKRKLIVNGQYLYTLPVSIIDLKNQIKNDIELWIKVFNIDFAYKKARGVPNMLVYSHRISGWLNLEYEITTNLKQQIITNFGYGSVSYFYSLLTFKNIQISPLSEWIDYHKSDFYEVMRYTKSFRRKTPVFDKLGIIHHYRIEIDNSNWYDAIEFTKDAANLSLKNEKEFIEKYIISECEIMVNGLERFYNETEFDFIDKNERNVEEEKITRRRIDIKGYELIEFRTEKIIGALDFILKINEYNSIIPTLVYTQRIISLSKKFIPTVFNAFQNQDAELKIAINNHNSFIPSYNLLIRKQNFYENEKLRLRNDFYNTYKQVYNEFLEKMSKSDDELKHLNHKINLHTENVKKLKMYLNKFKEIVQK